MPRARAFARAALAGNPSDAYGGATLAVVLRDFFAEVDASSASLASAVPESMLLHAAIRRFERDLAPEAHPAAVRLRTSIPRAVGLGGSSAIVIATVRALCELHRVRLRPDELASFALAVETEDLGIAVHGFPRSGVRTARPGVAATALRGLGHGGGRALRRDP
jgi:glucuronokinase